MGDYKDMHTCLYTQPGFCFKVAGENLLKCDIDKSLWLSCLVKINPVKHNFNCVKGLVTAEER